MKHTPERKLAPARFRVLNYRNIDDSDWIPLERVTAFVGRNESGKTSLLKALHKFNPAITEKYNPQREFPRDRFTAEYNEEKSWPVCQVEFKLSDEFQNELREKLKVEQIPTKAKLTRHFDNSLKYEYDIELLDDTIGPSELVNVLEKFAQGARRLAAPKQDCEEEIKDLRKELTDWADQNKVVSEELQELRTEEGIALLEKLHGELNGLGRPEAASLIERFKKMIKDLQGKAETMPMSQQLENAIKDELPVFIYFENYGILNSAIHLKQFIEDIAMDPNEPRLRTINAMFKHANLTVEEISSLGETETSNEGAEATPETRSRNQDKIDLRSVKLNSASIDISDKFSQWYGQRRHRIKYLADGQYFRIWVSDNLRPNVEIELENRSKGFQWFFSFYLVFLTESNDGHKDAILLLDEPGLHLHPTAQQELIGFFEELSETNPLIYTTHSPFLIDGKHIHRVRPVTEDNKGHSKIDVDGWPKDRETIFPLQAAAGYAMVKGLFQHKKNLLVEGLTDYMYLHALNLHCQASGKKHLPDDIYITPCGGTKHIGYLASLFLGQEVRPVILLDGDDAGRTRHDALIKTVYEGHDNAVLILSDVLNQEKCEIEDIIGESTILSVLRDVAGKEVVLNQTDRDEGSLVMQIKKATQRHQITLPDGWKQDVARRIIVEWSEKSPMDIPTETLDKAEKLFAALVGRFEDVKP